MILQSLPEPVEHSLDLTLRLRSGQLTRMPVLHKPARPSHWHFSKL